MSISPYSCIQEAIIYNSFQFAALSLSFVTHSVLCYTTGNTRVKKSTAACLQTTDEISYKFSWLAGMPEALGVVSPGQLLRGKQTGMKTWTQSSTKKQV